MDGIFAVKSVEVAVEHPAIELVCHPAAVVRLGNEIPQRIPRDLAVALEIGPQQIVRYAEIGVVKVVGDVESQRAEFSPFQQGAVKVGEGEEQF